MPRANKSQGAKTAGVILNFFRTAAMETAELVMDLCKDAINERKSKADKIREGQRRGDVATANTAVDRANQSAATGAGVTAKKKPGPKKKKGPKGQAATGTATRVKGPRHKVPAGLDEDAGINTDEDGTLPLTDVDVDPENPGDELNPQDGVTD